MRVETISYYPQPRLHPYGFETRDWLDYVALTLREMFLLDAEDEREKEQHLFRPFKVYDPELGEHPVAIRSLHALAGLQAALHARTEARRVSGFAKPPPACTGQRRGYDGEWYEWHYYDDEAVNFNHGYFGDRLEEPKLAPWTEDSLAWQMRDHFQWTYYTTMRALVTPGSKVLLDKDGEPIFMYSEDRAPEGSRIPLYKWMDFEEPETERLPYNPRLRALLDVEENATVSEYLEHLLGRISSAMEESLRSAEV